MSCCLGSSSVQPSCRLWPQQGSSAQSRMTLSTRSYHLLLTRTELKRAAEQDHRYSNVSMEFDAVSLRPTYRLLWGSAGASNALAIATTLGFDR